MIPEVIKIVPLICGVFLGALVLALLVMLTGYLWNPKSKKALPGRLLFSGIVTIFFLWVMIDPAGYSSARLGAMISPVLYVGLYLLLARRLKEKLAIGAGQH